MAVAASNDSASVARTSFIPRGLSATAAQELAKAVWVRLGGRLGLYELTHCVGHAQRVLERREVPGVLQHDEAAARHRRMRAAPVPHRDDRVAFPPDDQRGHLCGEIETVAGEYALSVRPD